MKMHDMLLKRIPLSTLIAVISAFAAIASAYFSYNQNQIQRKQLHLHVRPEVTINLSVFKKEEYFQPVLSFRNKSPVNILSLSANYLFLQFDKATKRFRDKLSLFLSKEQVFQGYVLFQKKIEPNDLVAAELRDVICASPTPQSIFVFVVFSTHYREGDMERFDNRRIYFFDSGKIFDQADFIAHSDYDKMFPLINTVRPPDFSSLAGMWGELLLQKSQADDKDAKTNTEKTMGLRVIHSDK
jgi:hypothetical protein